MSQIPFIQIEDDEHDVVIDLNADNNAAATLENVAFWPADVDGFNFHTPDPNLPATEIDTSSVSIVQITTHSGSRILDGSDPDSSPVSVVQNSHFGSRVLHGSDPDSSVMDVEGNQVGPVISWFGQWIELSGRDPNPNPDSDPGFVDEVVPMDFEDVLGSMFHHQGDSFASFVRELRQVGRERDDHEALSDEDGNEIQGRPPASKASVENLDSVVISEEGGKNDNEICGVCMDEMNVGERVKQLPCSHRYHGDCILPWLQIRNTCPVCRYELPTDDPDYELRRRGNAMT